MCAVFLAIIILITFSSCENMGLSSKATNTPINSDGPIETNSEEPDITDAPILSNSQSPAPSEEPINNTPIPSLNPTNEPTVEPTIEPTVQPTTEPTAQPTVAPTEQPTAKPTVAPSEQPTAEPTIQPTQIPTPEPTAEPTIEPTPIPTPEPTEAPTPTPLPTEEITLNQNNLSNGVIGISYNRESDSNLVVCITHDGVDEWYDLFPLVTGYYSLNEGNGTYKIRIAKEINNTGSFAVIFSKSVNLNLADNILVYKTSITEVFWTDQMAAIVFAYDRTKSQTYQWDMVVSLYQYMVTQYRYDYDKVEIVVGMNPGYIPDIEVVFHDEKLICHDYAVLFASMLRSLDIPTKLIKGYCENTNGYHAWNEVYNPNTGNWVVMDLTYDASYDEWGLEYEMEKDPDTYYPNQEF